MTFDDYKAVKAINATSLKAGRTSMLHMRHEMTREYSEPTVAMAWGTTIHQAVLEPDKYEKRLRIWDGGARRGKAWTEFKAENAGKTILTVQEAAQIEVIKNNIAQHPEAGMLLDSSQKEHYIFWEGKSYGEAKAALDCWDEAQGFVCDLKSTAKIHPREFQSQVFRLGYHIQAGWYAEGVSRLYGIEPSFYIIAVESKPPFDVVFYEMDADYLAAGREEAIHLARSYQAAEACNTWLGCAYDGIQTLTAPEWGKEEKDVSTGEMEASEL